jgi:flavorubredoxin
VEHLLLDPAKLRAVEDGEIISLGDKSLRFLFTPWVHWPETIVAYLAEEKILFSCDFLGSHSASSEIYDNGDPAVLEAAKRYYAEIMMPFRMQIRSNLQKISPLRDRAGCPQPRPDLEPSQYHH